MRNLIGLLGTGLGGFALLTVAGCDCQVDLTRVRAAHLLREVALEGGGEAGQQDEELGERLGRGDALGGEQLGEAIPFGAAEAYLERGAVRGERGVQGRDVTEKVRRIGRKDVRM